MTILNIYNDISARTQGDIYIGVVGPVRTGKSTFIKKFMESLVIPNISGEFQKERARDELPQSAAGRTIMTTEPKFIPEDAIELSMEDNIHFRVRLIDCVGYIVPSAVGYIEDEQPRMVHTPWFDEEVPFNMAAEIGTQKVIKEHSTIGLVITTDGSISQIPREEYAEAEERVINELKEINKPFVVALNCVEPESEEALSLAKSLSEKYNVPVLPINCLELDTAQISDLLEKALYEFPAKRIELNFPSWIKSLDENDEFKSNMFAFIGESAKSITNIRSVKSFAQSLSEYKEIEATAISDSDLSVGKISISVRINSRYYYTVLSSKCGCEIKNEKDLMSVVSELSKIKTKFDKFNSALGEVERTGYGIVMPDIDELTLEEPEIVKQGGRYGVKLKAQAPSIHMIRCNTRTEVAPIVGSESQSQELVMYLLREFQENPAKIWETDLFGKSLHELVNEGLRGKLERMPDEARDKFRETIERVINEGCSGLICIIL
ncbi:MAG: stage IV sporulation protein A [Clostridiales bacterium]|nr:stage IV sporulation protein A [Clostridiales bacterium]